MALDGTYSGLKASVAAWLNRQDLTDAIPDFIALAEAQISRRLIADGPVRRMMGRSDAVIVSEFVSLPDDFMGVRAIYLQGETRALQFVDDPEKILELKVQFPNKGGQPTHVAVVGGELQFWPWAGTGSYNAEMTYWKRIPALSVSAPSNWMLTLNPDGYLYGALLQASPYLKDDARLQTWAPLYQAVLADMVSADKVERRAPQMAMSVVPGGTP